MQSSLYHLFDYLELPDISIVDIGASPIDGTPPYQKLIDLDRANVIGFEPNPEQYQALLEQNNSKLRFLPYAVGDGLKSILNICQAPGMTSLLEPDFDILEHFHGFSDWAKIIDQQEVLTHRLDDIEEIEEIDYLKLDVQGGELTIINNGINKLKNTLVIHTEVNFVPFYKQQPLFAEIDQVLRQLGFYLHGFTPLVKRAFRPVMVNNSIYGGLNQVLWSDAIYVKKFTNFSELSSESLMKIAIIMNDLYNSFDLACLALHHIDLKEGTDFEPIYLESLVN
jgi:FkbM family methyltransferase